MPTFKIYTSVIVPDTVSLRFMVSNFFSCILKLTSMSFDLFMMLLRHWNSFLFQFTIKWISIQYLSTCHIKKMMCVFVKQQWLKKKKTQTQPFSFLILFSSNVWILCSKHWRRFCKGFENQSEIFVRFGMELKGRKPVTTEQCQKWSVIGE